MSEYKGWEPRDDLSEEQLETMHTEVIDKIITARIDLLLNHSFFGNMATRLKIRDASSWCNTAATDGRHLFYNIQFFHMLSPNNIKFVIAHEVYHVMFEHFIRQKDRHAKIWNIASDYVINGLLQKDGIGEVVTQLPIFLDRKYDDWSSEQVYSEIFEKYDEEELDALGQLLDDHIDWEEDGTGDGRPKYTREELRRIREEMRENMIAAAHTVGAGNLPAGVARLINQLTEHKMNWKEIIQQEIQSTIRNDFTFSRPSRRAWHLDAILPGMDFATEVEAHIAIDMSGSISQKQATDFLTEIKGITEEFEGYTIHVWCFDAGIHAPDSFTHDDGRNMTEYEAKGGGGTVFEVNWDYMKENDIIPKKFIMFTDGYPNGGWGDPDYCDTIFVIHDNPDTEAPFGRSIHYE